MKKSSIILSLLTLTIALATLPALGDLNYLKNNYNYLEKIPIKSISASVNNSGRNINNLLDNKKNTEWISWIENVVWAEDYSKDRYFISTAIDGANATTSVISNNTLSLAAIPASTTQVPTSRVWRQYQLFNDGNDSYPNEMSNLKAGLYTLKIKYRGTVAAENGLRVYLGNGNGSVGVIHDDVVSTDWIEKEIPLELPGDVATGAVCCVQPGHYPGTLEVESAELSYDRFEDYVYIVDYSGETFHADPDNSTLNTLTSSKVFLENGILKAQPTGEAYYQFRALNNLNLKPSTKYNVTFDIKGESVQNNITWWLGGATSFKEYNTANTLAYGKNFAPHTISFTTPENITDNNGLDPQVITIQPFFQGVTDNIEIKSVTIEELDSEGNPSTTTTYNYADFQNWPFKSEDDYIPALVVENGKTVVKVTDPGSGDYTFRLAQNFNLPKDSYTLKARINAKSTGNIHIMIGTGDRNVEQHFLLSVNPETTEYEFPNADYINLIRSNGYWIVCQPRGGYDGIVGDYSGDFTIESIELVAKTPIIENINITNDGNYAGGGDTEYREIKDGVIYSYPLPTTRKVIIATGDGGHNGEQYNNLSGFDFQNDRIYTVSYKIKSDNGGSVTTLLASNTSLNGLNGGDWNTANAIGKSDVVELQPGIEKTVYTSIRTNGTTNNWGSGAVMLDLGYNPGQVEVYDLKVCDNYDENLGNHESRIIPVKSESISKSSSNNFVTTQFFAIENFSFQQGVNYKINVTLKATEPGQLCIKIGDYWPSNNRNVKYQTFAGTGDWETLVFDFANNGNNPTSPWVTLQVQKQNPANPGGEGLNQYSGTVDFESLMLYHDDQPEELVKNWNFKGKDKFDCYVMGYEPKIENGVLVSQNNTWHQFRIIEGLPLDKNTSYKLYTRLKGQFARDNAINVQFGTWRENENVNKLLDIPSVMKENAVVFGRPVVDNNDITFQIGESYTGRVEYENFRLTKNPAQNIDRYIVFPELTGIPNSSNNEYRNMSLTSDGLEVKPQGIPLTLFDNLTFDINRDYTVKLDINVSHPGRYLVTLGDDNNISSGEIVVDESEVDRYVTKEVTIPVVTAQSGKMSLVPQVYTQNLSVQNYTLSYSTPQFDGASLRGTNFFDVELGDRYTMDQEGKYLFHIGYANGSDATPRKMVILGGKEKNGSYDILGEYEVENASDGNAFISTINAPLSIADSGIKFLRFFCSANDGGFTAVCFPKKADGSDDMDNAYISNMIQMTRFGIYKQSTMFATDKADPNVGTALNEETYEKYTHWAFPVITRFQIEALGKKYAYPGASLYDMIGVKKSVEMSGELFDNDYLGARYPRTTYWDTTLPFLKDKDRGDENQDIYQYIDYDNFTYPEEYDGNRDYDCIDLLLPDLEDLGVVKKLNGKIDTNGYYQLVVSMKRSTGSIDNYNNRLIYDTETADFKRRGNGFPMEISYKGLEINDKHEKNAKDIEGTERVLVFPNVAEGDSIQFALKVEKGWKGVRIFCRENTGNLQRRPGGVKSTNAKATEDNDNTRVVDVTHNVPGEGVDLSKTRIMRLGEIRAYVELEKIDIETEKGRERYDLLYNNRENFNTRSWEHNQGIIADINNLNTVNGSKEEKDDEDPEKDKYGQYMTKGSGGQTWMNVIDTYKDFFDTQGIAYPDFSLITNPFNDEDVVPSNGRKRNKSNYNGQKRQRTYTILHEVLALPGERVDLYPQSDIWQPNGFNYEEQFVRWYDYLTDKAPDYLYFFADPKSVIKTKDAGFIGGKTLLDHGLRGKGTVASIFYDEKARKDFEDKLKEDSEAEDERYYYDTEYSTVRIMDNWVAADFSLAFNTNLADRLGKNVKSWENEKSTIQEPIINFRHLFHITSGSLFADRYMSTAEGNQRYAKSNRRYISTFANKTFRIRLEQAMPVEASTKSAFYYKTDNGEYKRVRGYEIKTYKLGDGEKSDDRVAAINSSNLEVNATGMFGIDNGSIFDHIDSYVQTTTDPSKWLRNSKKFARSIVCNRTDAKVGRYLVRLYGKDESGNIIGLKSSESGNSTTKPLVIAEYEVEFMGEEYASFKSEDFLNNLTGKDYLTYGHHTESYLEDHYGNGKSEAKAVNFDKYMILNSESVIVNKGAAPVNLKRFGFFEDATPGFWGSDKTGTHVDYVLNDVVSRMKMPITWGDSNYGFGYQITGDYNMFRLASHSLMTPYMSAASTRGVDLDTDYIKVNNEYKQLVKETTTENDVDKVTIKIGETEVTVDGQNVEYEGQNYTKTHKMVGETLTWEEVDEDGTVHEKEKTGVQGTYDRLYYNTHGEQQGLFYYVNAAADPGEMVKIDFDYLCPGSTIYVSAWVNEFNQAQPETANVIFNFYANVAKNDADTGEKMIIRQEQIHGFATGYVNRNQYGFDESEERTGGDQGKWMHVYYTFVPDETHADIDKAEGEYIDSYYLVLENNCLSSEGADYAIDDIRAYVVAPRVEARQSNSLCEKNDVKVDIQVELPLEALEQSLADLVDKDGKVTLQYSIVDKVVYDDVLKKKKAAFDKTQEGKDKKEEYEPSSDDLREAFVAGVLHYKHTNILTDQKDEQGKYNVDYPLSWGEIEFYMDYNNKKYLKADGKTYDDTKKITGSDGNELSINGENLTRGAYMEKYIKDIYEKCFVFVTHPVSEDKDGNANYNEFVNTHREYFVVVGNFETTNLFTSISEDQKDKYNADVYPFNEDGGKYTKSENWKDFDNELAMAYQIGSECARMAAFSLKGSAQVVIDGVLHETDDNITCCENQRPVVQINLKTKEKGKEDLKVKDEAPESENPYLDWWIGQYEEFANMDTVINGKRYELWDVIDNFRTAYPNAESWNMPTVDIQPKVKPLGDKEIDNPYTIDMMTWLKDLCATTKINEKGETVPVEPKLVLHQSSFVFPQSATKLVDKNGKKIASKEIFVTAIPPATPTVIEEKDKTGKVIAEYVICTQPREVKITVSNTSPTLFNGFKDITYPDEIEDVPLRIGLKQLENIAEGGTNNLYVPLRNVKKATYDVLEFLPFRDDNNIYLVETNDPNYRKLSDHEKIDQKAPSDTYNVETRIVGKVTNLDVKFKPLKNEDTSENEDSSKVDGTPMVQVVFDAESSATQTTGDRLDNGITFREGYYYKFKFNFMEGETSLSGQEGYEMPCNGQTVFSIKVVPEYQVWTGGASLNWNNDDNWRRVSSADLLASNIDPKTNKLRLYDPESEAEQLEDKVKDAADYITNGSNPNTHSYAPLEFTKVIIPAGATYPQLAPKEHALATGGSTPVNDGKGSQSYTWTGTAPKAIPVANMTTDNYNVGDHKEGSNTQPTVYIHYDMAATLHDNDNNVYCRPWYANACEEIHFDSNAEILNQQYLDYEKAWVDMEMKPHRWYTVASPLYGVVAGDMYLPKADARQATELFTPITYKEELNDRFQPAVYQRGWDKGNETVYLLTRDNGSDNNKENAVGTPTETVALASTWSHVYNDVQEKYTVGAGYSVKTDVSRYEQGGTTFNDLVKFRFPKADTFFDYYEDGKPKEPGRENGNNVDRTDKHRLYGFETAGEVILKKANPGNLFLVGNPFMSHLDMKKFLAANIGEIAQKFWIMTENQQLTGVFDENGNLIFNGTISEKDDKFVEEKETQESEGSEAQEGEASEETRAADENETDYRYLAPMQGFFVQAKTAGTTLSIKFTPDMMAVSNVPDAPEGYKPDHLLKAPRPETRADGEDIIRVSTAESTAIIRLSGSADKGYSASEDVEMIDDSNQRNMRRIYTVAGTMASAINQTPDADGVEVGLMAPTDSVTVVTFNGLALEDYMLYDTTTGEKTQLYDGFELEMTGSVSGRYFLTNGVDTVEIEDGSIRILPVGHEVVVKAPAVCGELTVRVFDTLGREVAKADGFEQEVRIALEPGIYAVEATGSDTGHKTAKLSVR